MGHAQLEGLDDVLVGFGNVFLEFEAGVQNEELEVTLSIASLGCFDEKSLALIQVLCNTKTFQVVNTEPVGTDNVALFSGNRVLLSRLFLVLLSVSDLGKGASSTARVRPLDGLLKQRNNFLKYRASAEPDIEVGFVLDSKQVLVVDGCLDPVETLLFVAGNALRETALNLELTQGVTSIIR